MSISNLENLKEQFCKYSVTDKLFEEMSLPASLWEVFHEMKFKPMSLCQISKALCVNSNDISTFIEELVEKKALEKCGENVSYADWSDDLVGTLVESNEVVAEISSQKLVKNSNADENVSKTEAVEIDIDSDYADSVVMSFDID